MGCLRSIAMQCGNVGKSVVKRAILRGIQSHHLQNLVQSGRYREALECYGSIEDSAQRLDPECQLLAGDAAARLGDVPQSSTLVSRAFYQFNTLALRHGRMRAANLLGAIEFERGHINNAATHFSTAYHLAIGLNESAFAARAGNNLAIIADVKGDRATAIALYRKSETIFRGLNDHRGGAETCHNLGLVFRHLGLLAEAAEAAAESARLAGLCGFRSLQGLAVLGQAEVALARGCLDEASAHIIRGAALAAEGADPFNGLEAGRLRAMLAYRRGDYAIAHHLAEFAGSLAAAGESALLRVECGMISALSLRAMHRDLDAARVRREVVAGLHELGATDLLERFDRAWMN